MLSCDMKLCDTVVVVQLFLHCNITNVADHVQFVQSLMLKSVASAYFAADIGCLFLSCQDTD